MEDLRNLSVIVFLSPLCRSLTLLLALVLTAPAAAAPTGPHSLFDSWTEDYDAFGKKVTVGGSVSGNGNPLPDYRVSLYASYVGAAKHGRVIARTHTNASGNFKLHYRKPFGLSPRLKPVYFIIAEKGPKMLASVIGSGYRVPRHVVVNERTTVATAVAYAQFIHGRKIRGNTYGMLNAVKMAANMADPRTGEVSPVLRRKPNGNDTDTYKTFNALSNVAAACIASAGNCDALFTATTPGGEPEPENILEALTNLTRHPAYPNYPNNVDDPIYLLSLASPIYQPALNDRPTSWLLFLKFTGGFYSEQDSDNLMNGPGNIAIDERGYAWVVDNYKPTPPDEYACTGQRLLKFFPWGETFPGSPYFGGGLSGAGFGITFDPRGLLWVGNFGFEAPACADGTVPPDPARKIPASHNSVSLFHPSGIPLSPPSGFTRGNIWWPQGTVSDKQGNIWVANCGNDTVTLIPEGNPLLARNIPLPGATSGDTPNLKPFAIAIDPDGRAWVTGNQSAEVYRISADGTVEVVDSSSVDLSWIIGISGDSKGNMWVSSSDAVKLPCADPFDPQEGNQPSIVLFPADGSAPKQITSEGGLTLPWGSAVDGSDSLWVFNFGRTPFESATDDTEWDDTGISHFCGSGDCPQGLEMGDAISPFTGYTSNALERITGGGIDPSGNIWLMNNWKKPGPLLYDINPGENSIVIVPGAATPVRTPLIGPPRSFDSAQYPPP